MAGVGLDVGVADETRLDEEVGSPFHQSEGVLGENCHGPSFQRIHLEGDIHHDPCHQMETLYVPGEGGISHHPPEVEGDVPDNQNAHPGAIFHWNSFLGGTVGSPLTD